MMKFSFRKSASKSKRESRQGGEGASSSGRGVKASLQLRLLSGLKWEANAPKAVTVGRGEKAEKGVVKVRPSNVTPLWPDLDTLQGCTDFLKSSGLNVHALGHAASMVDHFKGSYQMGDSSLPDELRLEAWKGTLRRIVKTLVDQLLVCNPRLECCVENEEQMKQLWSACEAWVLGAAYDKIMGACKQMFGQSDKLLDQTLGKLDNVDPLVLGVRGEFKDFVLGDALLQFRSINRLRTPREKAVCLRKTINCIMEGIQSVITSCKGTAADTDGLLPCTDDLLSFMLLLMARARVTNLQANACYMENFLSLRSQEGEGGELSYHVTNFVAACNYLNSDEIQKLVAGLAASPIPQSSSPISKTASPSGRSASPEGGRYSSVDSPPVRPTGRSSTLLDEFQHVNMNGSSSAAYSRSYSSEPSVHTMSTGDILSMNLFGRDLTDSYPSEIGIKGTIKGDVRAVPVRRTVSDKTLGSGRREEIGKGSFRGHLDSLWPADGKPGIAFPGGSPEFILAPTYQ